MIAKILVTLLLLPITIAVGDIAPLRKGDDASRIQEVLGEPLGFMETGTQGVYYYDRGEVHTRHGKVTLIYLLSPEVLAEQQALEAALRKQRLQEGQELLAEIMAQGGIGHLSGTSQLQYWENFRASYPEVDIQLLYREASQLAQQEQKEEEEARRLARLEQRVLQAEIRAAQAQEQAARAQQTASIRSTRYSYGPSCWYVPRSGYVIRYRQKSQPEPYTPHIYRSPMNDLPVAPRLTGDTTLISRHLQ